LRRSSTPCFDAIDFSDMTLSIPKFF